MEKRHLLQEPSVIPTGPRARRASIAFILAVCAGSLALADSSHFTVLDAPGGTGTVARALNDRGEVTGSYVGAGITRGFLYSRGAFSPVDVSGAASTTPSAIDGNGRIAGSFLGQDGAAHGFIYTKGAFTTIDIPGAIGTRLLGMNSAGEAVGAFTDTIGEHGFLYVDGVFTPLDFPGAVSTNATGINGAGEIVGVYTDSKSAVHGFLYNRGFFSQLDSPGGDQPVSLGINDASKISGFPGWIYRDGTFVAIPKILANAHRSAINNAGQIAGSYRDAGGVEHGFVAELPADSTAPSAPRVITSTIRSGVVSKASSGVGVCDVTGDGFATVADTQAMLNEALGTRSPSNDLNGDHVVNVVDVEMVISAALGHGCGSSGVGGGGTVAHLTAQVGNGQVACICFTSTLQAFQPLSVKATDSNGLPVSGATVNWVVTSGQMTVNNPTSVTDSNGIASVPVQLIIFNNFTSAAVPYLTNTVQATSGSASFTFNETQSLITSQGSSVILANPPQFNGDQLGSATLVGSVGSTLSIPITTNIGGTGVASNGVQNVSVRILNQQSSPAVTCVTGGNGADPGSVLSDISGNTSCYPTFSGTGSGQFYILIGGVPGTDISSALYLQALGPFNFTSQAGAVSGFQIVSGNNQVVPIGQTFNALVAKLVDGGGNPIPGQTVTWSVVPPGAASLNLSSFVTDSSGQVSITGTLGSLASAGAQIIVALASNPSVSATFQETVPNALTGLSIVSGNNQSAVKGTAFANSLVVQLVTASGPAPNFLIHYSSTGPINLGSTIAATDSNGRATITVSAGSSPGSATVTATAAALTQTFNLTVTGQ